MNSQNNGQFSEQLAELGELTNHIMDQIRKLGELHEAGILTDEEFVAKKKDLLGRI